MTCSYWHVISAGIHSIFVHPIRKVAASWDLSYGKEHLRESKQEQRLEYYAYEQHTSVEEVAAASRRCADASLVAEISSTENY
jgi:hypothetical protein